jgi:hypothetical protein
MKSFSAVTVTLLGTLFMVTMMVMIPPVTVTAFAPAPRPIFTPGRLIQGQTSIKSFVLQAEEKQDAVEESARVVSSTSNDGTYYDDEVRQMHDFMISFLLLHCISQPFFRW